MYLKAIFKNHPDRNGDPDVYTKVLTEKQTSGYIWELLQTEVESSRSKLLTSSNVKERAIIIREKARRMRYKLTKDDCTKNTYILLLNDVRIEAESKSNMTQQQVEERRLIKGPVYDIMLRHCFYWLYTCTGLLPDTIDNIDELYTFASLKITNGTQCFLNQERLLAKKIWYRLNTSWQDVSIVDAKECAVSIVNKEYESWKKLENIDTEQSETKRNEKSRRRKTMSMSTEEKEADQTSTEKDDDSSSLPSPKRSCHHLRIEDLHKTTIDSMMNIFKIFQNQHTDLCKHFDKGKQDTSNSNLFNIKILVERVLTLKNRNRDDNSDKYNKTFTLFRIMQNIQQRRQLHSSSLIEIDGFLYTTFDEAWEILVQEIPFVTKIMVDIVRLIMFPTSELLTILKARFRDLNAREATLFAHIMKCDSWDFSTYLGEALKPRKRVKLCSAKVNGGGQCRTYALQNLELCSRHYRMRYKEKVS